MVTESATPSFHREKKVHPCLPQESTEMLESPSTVDMFLNHSEEIWHIPNSCPCGLWPVFLSRRLQGLHFIAGGSEISFYAFVSNLGPSVSTVCLSLWKLCSSSWETVLYYSFDHLLPSIWFSAPPLPSPFFFFPCFLFCFYINFFQLLSPKISITF